jgi:hypothetical protein
MLYFPELANLNFYTYIYAHFTQQTNLLHQNHNNEHGRQRPKHGTQ